MRLKMVRSSFESLWARVFALLLAVTLISVILPGCALFPTEEEVLAPPLVKPVEIELEEYVVERREKIQETIIGNGNLMFEKSSRLFVTFSGSKLKDIYVNLDEEVTAGQLVGELENQYLVESIHDTKARLAKAELQMDLFELEHRNIAQSADKTGVDYEKYLLNKQISQINIDRIKDRLAQAQAEYELTFLKSPCDGIVIYMTSKRDGDSISAYESIFQVFDSVSGKTANISRSYSSRLKTTYVLSGASVKKDELLGELDNADIQDSIKELNADLHKAEIYLELYELEAGNAAQDDDGTDKDAEYQKYLLTKQIMEIDISLIKEDLAKIQEEYEQTLLKSPIYGIVNGKTDVEQGGFINAYDTILQIADPSQLLLNWQLDASVNTQLIHTGAEVGVTINRLQYTGKVVATPSDLIRQKDRDDLGKTVLIKVDGLPQDIEEGMYGRISYVIKESTDTLVIPSRALMSEGSKTYVYVKEGSLKRERIIELGIRTPSEVEVVKGLKEGEVIIIPE